MKYSTILCRLVISNLILGIAFSNAFCIQTTSTFVVPGTYQYTCSLEQPCDTTQGLQCINNSCNCTENFPFWSGWEAQCVRCDSGWTYLNYRCILPVQSAPVLYNDAQTYCSSLNSSVLEFYDDMDLNSCIKTTAPNDGFFLSAIYDQEFLCFNMPSYYTIVPGSQYWCNSLPQVVYDCLIVLPNSDGVGSCLYSAPCNTSHSIICQKDTMLVTGGYGSFISNIISILSSIHNNETGFILQSDLFGHLNKHRLRLRSLTNFINEK